MLKLLNSDLGNVYKKDRIRSVLVDNMFGTSLDWVDAAVVKSSGVQWCEWNHSSSFDVPEQLLQVAFADARPSSMSSVLLRCNIQYHSVLIDMLNVAKKMKYPLFRQIVEGYKLTCIRKSIWGRLIATDGLSTMFFVFRSLPRSVKQYYRKKGIPTFRRSRFRKGKRSVFPKKLELGPWFASMPIRFKKIRRRGKGKIKSKVKSFKFRPQFVCVRKKIRRGPVMRRLRRLRYYKLVR